MNNTNRLIFVGGVGNKRINDNKDLSRNYRQGNRVYDSKGIAQTIMAESLGGLGGYSSLYLVEVNENVFG